MVKTLTCYLGGMGLIPGWVPKIPDATWQLSPHAAATKPECLKPVLCNKRSHRNEKPSDCKMKSSPQLEKAHTQQRRPSAVINKINKKKIPKQLLELLNRYSKMSVHTDIDK